VDETIALRAMQRRADVLPGVLAKIHEAHAIVSEWLVGHAYLECVPPGGGVVCFPRFQESVKLDVDKFYKELFTEHGTVVGPGHWFEQSRRSFRLGYGWPTLDELRAGLAGIDAAAKASLL
jgi:aspartate/methionine/tyrosine aminotransferase